VSRYRPPTPPGSKYITPEGAKRLQDELDQLWHEERPRVTQAVSEAAAQGDRSENAEYTYGKRRLHEIDRRVRFLRKRLEGMSIIDPVAGLARRDPKRVYFGAWVQIESDAGALRWHRIVGPDEFDMDNDYVSMDSPLGRCLMGKGIDDEVTVDLPGGAATITVAAISYAARPAEYPLKPPECS
jgi:transcription elongation factor GreB